MTPDSKGRLHGKVATYRKDRNSGGRKVFITNHIFYENGGISNWVDFRYIKPDGTLGKSSGDYDMGGNFVNALKIPKVRIVVPKKFLRTQGKN